MLRSAGREAAHLHEHVERRGELRQVGEAHVVGLRCGLARVARGARSASTGDAPSRRRAASCSPRSPAVVMGLRFAIDAGERRAGTRAAGRGPPAGAAGARRVADEHGRRLAHGLHRRVGRAHHRAVDGRAGGRRLVGLPTAAAAAPGGWARSTGRTRRRPAASRWAPACRRRPSRSRRAARAAAVAGSAEAHGRDAAERVGHRERDERLEDRLQQRLVGRRRRRGVSGGSSGGVNAPE